MNHDITQRLDPAAPQLVILAAGLHLIDLPLEELCPLIEHVLDLDFDAVMAAWRSQRMGGGGGGCYSCFEQDSHK